MAANLIISKTLPLHEMRTHVFDFDQLPHHSKCCKAGFRCSTKQLNPEQSQSTMPSGLQTSGRTGPEHKEDTWNLQGMRGRLQLRFRLPEAEDLYERRLRTG